MTDEILSYAFVSLPNVANKDKTPDKREPMGHQEFVNNCLHGYLDLQLTAQQPIHVSAGITVMGSDIGSHCSLIRPMMQLPNATLFIPGSSLKGCMRSVYEAITNSTVGTQTANVSTEYKPCTGSQKLCPASRVFGALGYQGLIEFTDAICDTPAALGDIPVMHSPKSGTRRKFYYTSSVEASDPQSLSGVPIQEAPIGAIFKTRLQFKNLLPEELGTLLIVLGQDEDYPIALKLGAGKAHGKGMLVTQILRAQLYETEDLIKDRYSSYNLEPSSINCSWDKYLRSAHEQIIQKPQLEILTNILRKTIS